MKFTEDQFDSFPVGTQINYTVDDGQTGTVIRCAGDGSASTNGMQIAGGRHWRQIATWPGTEFEVVHIPGFRPNPDAGHINAILMGLNPAVRRP